MPEIFFKLPNNLKKKTVPKCTAFQAFQSVPGWLRMVRHSLSRAENPLLSTGEIRQIALLHTSVLAVASFY